MMNDKDYEVVVDAPNPQRLIDLLNLIFSTSVSGDEKVRRLIEDFEFDFDEDFFENIRECTSLGQMVEQRGIEKGLLQGFVFSVKALMKNKNLTLEEAMSAIDLPESTKDVLEKYVK